MATFEDLSRQRIDFSVGPNGETIGKLTLTLQDGTVFQHTASVDQDEIDAFASAIATYETRARQQTQVAGYYSDDEIAGFFDFIGDGIKAVGSVAKDIVTSKVFKGIGTGLLAAAPILGPLAPIAIGVGGAMKTASTLTSAATAALGGARSAAGALTRSAGRTATRITGHPRSGGAMMQVANRKRKAAAAVQFRAGMTPRVAPLTASQRFRASQARGIARTKAAKAGAAPKRLGTFTILRGLAGRPLPKGVKRGAPPTLKKKPPKEKPAAKKKPAKKKTKKVKKLSVLKAAKTGRLHSNKPGAVTAKALREASRRGRVFWVAA